MEPMGRPSQKHNTPNPKAEAQDVVRQRRVVGRPWRRRWPMDLECLLWQVRAGREQAEEGYPERLQPGQPQLEPSSGQENPAGRVREAGAAAITVEVEIVTMATMAVDLRAVQSLVLLLYSLDLGFRV